jgi:hypothetical protein
MNFIHRDLANGGWAKLSLMEQLGNIGSEVSRAGNWQNKNKEIFNGAVERALELFDLTLEDSRWAGRKREINRAREVFCDAILGGKEYGSTLKSLNCYFLPFAFAANAEK